MRDQDEVNLLIFMKKDIIKLENALLNSDEDFKEVFKLVRSSIPFFTFEFSYFIELLNKYCFSLLNQSKTELSENPLLLERFTLFQKIFLKDIQTKNSFLNIQDLDSASPTFHPILLFLLLYYSIFEEYIKTGNETKDIYDMLKNEWFDSIKSKSLKIKTIIHLPIFSIVGQHQIDERIKLISARPPLKFIKKMGQKRVYDEYKSSYYRFGMDISNYIEHADEIDQENLTTMRIYVVLNFMVKSHLFEDMSSHEEIFGEVEEEKKMIEESIKEFLICFYLLNKEFEYKGFVIEYPWWFVPNENRFDKFEEPIKRAIFVDKDEFKKLKEIYQKVKDTEIFNSKQFKIVKYRYFQINNNRGLQDLILDYFIILEFFFTRNMMSELKFRLSLNSALFISSNWKKFNKLYHFLGELYNLRSIIIHGSDVNKKIESFVNKYKFQHTHHFLFEIKEVLNKILLKFIDLKIKDPQILKKFENPLFFLFHSKLDEKMDE